MFVEKYKDCYRDRGYYLFHDNPCYRSEQMDSEKIENLKKYSGYEGNFKFCVRGCINLILDPNDAGKSLHFPYECFEWVDRKNMFDGVDDHLFTME